MISIIMKYVTEHQTPHNMKLFVSINGLYPFLVRRTFDSAFGRFSSNISQDQGQSHDDYLQRVFKKR